MKRRDFIKTAAVSAVGLTIVPSNVIAGLGHKAPSDKLNIAGIGVGGRGFGNLKEMENENIVALCDVDWNYSKRVFDYFPKAKRFRDWRLMYDEFKDSFDAIMISTADHTHATIGAYGMELGKHIYLQKPLTHSVYESRLLTKLADKYKVATSMGNQGSSDDDSSKTIEWLQDEVIGPVKKVETWTDRPIWPQGLNRPEPGMWVPDYLDWDLFIGPAETRPYHKLYHPWNWRGWWDFGVGALGDMGCHILHPVYFGLNLKFPSRLQATSTLLLNDCAPSAQTVKMVFPERENFKYNKNKLPEVEVYWYDGGLRPMLPDRWPEGKELEAGGAIYYGEKDILITGSKGHRPWLLSGNVPNVKQTRRRVKATHEMDWVRACKESPENRMPTMSDFEEAGPFNEMVVIGTAAVRLQSLSKELEWDGENMQFTNISDNEKIKTVIKDDFEITDGHPTFNQIWTEPYNAKKFAEEIIKHTYREPWGLPDMPK